MKLGEGPSVGFYVCHCLEGTVPALCQGICSSAGVMTGYRREKAARNRMCLKDSLRNENLERKSAAL